jgi:aspartyl-tRNA(Asn)/glutamyl-tRNA(Gln) amidotransferase subunit A
MSPDPNYRTAVDLLDDFRSGALCPSEVAQQTLGRIAAVNPLVNAFRDVTAEVALAAARQAQARYAANQVRGLDGLCISVKDTLMVKGMAFRRGSLATSTQPAEESAPVVDAILQSGAAVLGITTTAEFGAGPITVSPLSGITRNPWDLHLHAGGSSGGAAAAVASGMGPVALATDAGGSTRVPSALCGVIGFKPTGGKLPTYPPNVAGALSAPGLIARDVRDIALIMDHVARSDVRDPEMLPPGDERYLSELLADAQDPGRLAPLRIAYSTTLGYAQKVQDDVAHAVEAAADRLRELGHVVERAHPQVEDPTRAFLVLFHSGFAHTARDFTEEQMRQIGPALREAVVAGRKIPLADYLMAQDVRRLLARRFNEFHGSYDILITPTTAATAFEVDRTVPEGFEKLSTSRAWVPFTSIFNITQQPAISVPCGLDANGRPIGMQIVGPRFSDLRVLRLAWQFTRSRSPLRPAFRNSELNRAS